MTNNERQALIDEISSTLSDCNHRIEALRAARVAAIEAIPATRPASIAHTDALKRTQARLDAELAQAAGDFEIAFEKAGLDKQAAEQAADDVRRDDPAEQKRNDAIETAQFDFEVAAREARSGAVSPFDADASVRKAAETRDIAIARAEQRFESESLNADEVRRRAFDAAGIAQDAAIRAANIERSRREESARRAFDAAVADANSTLASALMGVPEASRAAADIDATIAERQQECDSRVAVLQARLRQLARF